MELIRLKKEQIRTYIEVGIKSYCQHYLHLWEDRDPEPYISKSFTENVVIDELQDANVVHFLTTHEDQVVGIIKVLINAALGETPSEKAMLLEKIYLLSEYAGQGLGRQCLDHMVELAKAENKEVLWLDTMKNGRALSFYLDYGFTISGERELEFAKAIPAEKPMYILKYDLF